jgi:hypothetical protein
MGALGVPRALVWGALLLASFDGWGALVNRALAPARRFDAGLRAALGMCAFVLVGGFLCLAHLALRPVVLAHVGAGVVASVASWKKRARPAVTAVVAVVVLLTVLCVVAECGDHRFQTSDDLPFYFMLPEKLLQTGSMFEPFAARRASLFGGLVYLNAAFVAGASPYYLFVVDAGLSVVLVLALLGGMLRPLEGRLQAVQLALAAALLFTFRDVRVNTNSEVSGVVVLLALYRMAGEPLRADGARPLWPVEPGRLVALSALALTAILLRISNAPAVLLFLSFVVAHDFLRGADRPWSGPGLLTLGRASALAIAVFAVGLLPWAILQRESSGTFFYPFGRSHVTPGWTFLVTPASLGQEARELFVHLTYGRPVSIFPIFAAAGFFPLASTGRRHDLALFNLAVLLGLAYFAHSAVAFGPNNTARYYFSSVAAAELLVVATVQGVGLRTAVVAAGLLAHALFDFESVGRHLAYQMQCLARALAEPAERLEAFERRSGDYEDVQSHVPAGATMATAVMQGFRWDFRRNTVYTLDVLGGMGPDPGWPAHQGPEALADYLRAQGVEYLIWVDWDLDNEFYGRAHWRSHLDKAGTYLQGEAALQLDAEDSIEKLAALRRVVYRGHEMTVIDLKARQ